MIMEFKKCIFWQHIFINTYFVEHLSHQKITSVFQSAVIFIKSYLPTLRRAGYDTSSIF